MNELQRAAEQMRDDWAGALPEDGNEAYTWQFVAEWLDQTATQCILLRVDPPLTAVKVARAYLGVRP